MFTVTEDFQIAVKAPARQTIAAVVMTLNSLVRPRTVTVADAGTVVEAPNIVRGFISREEHIYVGAECPTILKEPYSPFVSESRSNAGGVFEDPPVITIQYDIPHNTRNFLITGNPNDLIRNCLVKVYLGASVVYETHLEVQRSRDGLVFPTPIRCDRIEVTILSTYLPDRPATIYYCGSPGTLIIEKDHFADLTLLEEVGSGDLLPYAGVTANETDITLDNIDSIFTPSNKYSPLHGLMSPGSPVEVFFGVAIANETYETIPMGTFFVTEWSAPNESAFSNITAHDRLYDLIGMDAPLLRVVHGETITGLFRRMCDALGIPSNKYVIKVNKTVPVTFGYPLGTTVGEAFDTLCEAGLCYIYVDRKDRITLSDQLSLNPLLTMTDDDYIQTINNLERYDTIYNKLTVDIFEPILRRNDKALEGYDVAAEPGVTLLDDIEFSDAPVLLLNSVAVMDNFKVRIKETAYGYDRLRLTLENTSPEVIKAKLNASVTYIDSIKRTRSIEGNPISRSQLKISNPLVQTTEHANQILAGMKEAISDPFSLFELDSRGNPALEVGDVITLQAPAAKILQEVVEIRRASFRFDGGLECSYTTRRVKYDG